jgi:methionyl-tRNA formyltransferase
LHPALLPANRGPAPLFWTFREGFTHAGVTAHLMDGGLDSGPIVAQEGFELADGTTGDELELRCAALGGEVLVAAARGLADGTLRPRPQDEARATTYPWPCADDFVITPDRPARWAFNFIRGTAGWGYPHRLVTPAGSLTVRAALAYDPAARLGAPLVREGDEVRVQCAPGVLTVAVEGPQVAGQRS